MDIIDISDKLANISPVWKKFCDKVKNENKVNISMAQDEYLPWAMAVCSNKKEVNIIICRDYVWANSIESIV